MGVGCPEYVLLFRKLPSNTGLRRYAGKENKTGIQPRTLAVRRARFLEKFGRWLVTKEELETLSVKKLNSSIRIYSRRMYSYEEHVSLRKGGSTVKTIARPNVYGDSSSFLD